MNTFSASNIISLDIAMAYMHILNMISEEEDETINKVKKNIFIKEIAEEHIQEYFLLCAILFYNNDDEMNKDNRLFAINTYIKNSIFRLFGSEEDEDDYSYNYNYEAVKSTPSVYLTEGVYGHKHLIVEENIATMRKNLITNWKNLSDDKKSEWVKVLFISLDYATLHFLFEAYENEVIDALLLHLDKEQFNELFYRLLHMYEFANEFNNKVDVRTRLALDFFIYLNKNVLLNDVLLANLNKELLEIYLDISNIILNEEE